MLHRKIKKEKRKRKIRNEEARKLNNQFGKEQKVIFDKFKDCIEDDGENMKPIFKEKEKERRFFNDPVVVENFWRSLWEKVDSGNPDAEWIKEIKNKFIELIPNVYEGNLVVNDYVASKAIKKKKNWTSHGPDKITNFWWKKLKSVSSMCTKVFNKVLNDDIELLCWVCMGIVALLPKLGEWSESNQRPITCLNTIYKWFTSILRCFHNEHLKKYGILQVDRIDRFV